MSQNDLWAVYENMRCMSIDCGKITKVMVAQVGQPLCCPVCGYQNPPGLSVLGPDRIKINDIIYTVWAAYGVIAGPDGSPSAVITCPNCSQDGIIAAWDNIRSDGLISESITCPDCGHAARLKLKGWLP